MCRSSREEEARGEIIRGITYSRLITWAQQDTRADKALVTNSVGSPAHGPHVRIYTITNEKYPSLAPEREKRYSNWLNSLQNKKMYHSRLGRGFRSVIIAQQGNRYHFFEGYSAVCRSITKISLSLPPCICEHELGASWARGVSASGSIQT